MAYGLGDNARDLLVALSLFKARRFLSTGLRLRTACDLEVVGDLAVTRPADFTMPEEETLLNECTRLIAACKSHFANPSITQVEWKKKGGKSKKGEAKEDRSKGDQNESGDSDE